MYLILLTLTLLLTGCATRDQVRHDGVVTNTSRVLGQPVSGGVLRERWPNVTVTWRFECASGGCGRLLPGQTTIVCDRHNPLLGGRGRVQPQILKNCRTSR